MQNLFAQEKQMGWKIWQLGLMLAISCILWLIPGIPGAYFQDLGMGVRPVGMGEAFTAVADDSNAMLLNIAGIADLEKREFNFMYSDIFSNLNARLYTGENDSLGYHNVAAVLPLDPQIGAFGFTWTLFNSHFYRENSFILGYAREVGPELFEWMKISDKLKDLKLNAGLNLKILNWQVDANEYTAANPVFDGNGLARTGFTADIGLLAAYQKNIKFGLSLENFIPANVGLTVYETVPINFRLGVSYLHDWQGKIDYVDSVLGAIDFTQRNGLSDIRVGAEGWFFKQLVGLRAGTTADQFTTGLSVNAILSNSPVDLRLDYAFAYPYGIEATWGSHRMSLIIRWGKPVERPEVVVIEPEENLAEKRDQELAEQRAQEEARLKALKAQLRAEIKEVRKELNRISELIKLGQIPSIQFESGKTILRRNSFKSLDQISAMLEKYPRIRVRLEGHTDSQGKAKLNQKLSQRRVESVKEYMLGKFKLNSYNLIPVGYGETRPIADNKTAKGRAANRRVEIKVLIPAGMEAPAAPSGPKDAAEDTVKEPISPEDIISYEELDKLREKLKVYEMQMSTDEVEELFEQQHQENGKNQVKEKRKKK